MNKSLHYINSTSGNVLLKSVKCSLPAINISLLNPFIQTFNKPIGSISLDTYYLKCPYILINFTGILITSPTNSDLRLTTTFTLFKNCGKEKIPCPIATYNFNIEHLSVLSFPLTNTHTIIFNYSPCDDSWSDCCTYTLEFTRVSAFFDSSGSISIDGTFSALALGS